MNEQQLHELNMTAREADALPPVQRAIAEFLTQPEEDAPSERLTAVVSVGAMDWAPGPGEYLFNVWEDGSVTMAWRREPGDAWGPPITGRRA